MRVRCDRCKTEYDLDAARVTEAGVAVRCRCGNVFRVKRRAAVQAPAPAPAPAPALAPNPPPPPSPEFFEPPGESAGTPKASPPAPVAAPGPSPDARPWSELEVDAALSLAADPFQATRGEVFSISPPSPLRPLPPTPSRIAGVDVVRPVPPLVAPSVAEPSGAGFAAVVERDPRYGAQAPRAPETKPAVAAAGRPRRLLRLAVGTALATGLALVAGGATGYWLVRRAAEPTVRIGRAAQAAARASSAAAPAQPAPAAPAQPPATSAQPALATPSQPPATQAQPASPAPVQVVQPAPSGPTAPASATQPAPPDPVPTATASRAPPPAPEAAAPVVAAPPPAAARPSPQLRPAAASVTKLASAPAPTPREAPLATLLAEARQARRRGKTERALTLFGRVAELDPTRVEALSGRGWCYLELSRYDPAEASFRWALQQDPSYGEALIGLAETYRYEGRKSDAVRYYQQYLAAHPQGDEATTARNAIQALEE